MNVSSRLIALFALIAPVTAIADAPQTPPGVKAIVNDLGATFVTADGMSLYTYDLDQPAGVSTCIDRCAEQWPPFTAPAGAAPTGAWSVIARPDGSPQWAFKGKPVYTFARDRHPGATLGDGSRDVWHVAVALNEKPYWVTIKGSLLGRVAANSQGLTLYFRDSSGAACADDCLRAWTPFRAPAIAQAVGDWSVVEMADGSTQWAYRGAPLYTFSGDVTAGETTGHGVDGGWRALVLDPAPPAPDWVTVQLSDFGPILADAEGLTIYSAPPNYDTVLVTMCNAECLAENWRLVEADEGAVGHGNWSIVTGENGKRHWTFRGLAVYSHTRDKAPGEIEGDRFAAGIGQGGWSVIPLGDLVPASLPASL